MAGPKGRGASRGAIRGAQFGQQRGHTWPASCQSTDYASNPSLKKPSKIDRQTLSNDQGTNEHLKESFRKVDRHQRKRVDMARSDSQNTGFDLSLNTEIRKYMQHQRELNAANEKDRWINSSEIPKSDEIKLGMGTTVDLYPNKIHGRFKSPRNYLRTHYRLLREDSVGPLRDAIDKYCKNPEMEDDADLSIYEKVHICGFTFTSMGIAARLKFSTRRAGRRILWSASKRLVSGSLVAMSPSEDNFNSKCLIAIVAARPLELLERSPPEVDIYFSCPADIQIDPRISYVMLEAKSGYFEAHRHTLKALQKLSSESFPLSPHIIGTEMDIGPPEYLIDSPKKSLETTLNSSEQHLSGSLSIDILKEWPETPNGSSLDSSQWSALNQILTKKIAIIQGPPGTGKTHISKIALQIMVQNKAEGDPPIIVAAQTNHALDQLLKHISQFDPEYIRLGGRSTNLEVKKRALYEVRQREIIPKIAGSLLGPAKRKLEREHTKYGEMLSIFDANEDLISCEKLFQLKVINDRQRQSLVDAASNWITTAEDSPGPIRYWLHQALIPFDLVYEDDTFGFDNQEEDLEIEQLRETEAEHGVADEEDIEMLKGPWSAVSDNWTVGAHSENDLEKAKKMLDTKDDLWDIPEYLRGATYSIMKQKAKDVTLAKFKEAALEYDQIVAELKVGKWEKDAVFLKRANIIGMTTTGLSKYRPLIASLQPKIVLIEEAAEVIEAPVTAACMESVEHLILVGDHQQLQGHCALQELEGYPFHLNVSMFERLVNLGIPFRTLSRQRRMAPEIRELVSSLYPDLKDHESVLTRQELPPWGTGTIRSFFFHHDWSELKDESLSTYNEEEARVVAKFYRHLLRHGVPPAAITILTFYNGQRKRILKELKYDNETNGSYNNVKTVDSYQGEENDIVILSLVRSNNQSQIGFLEITNRVCVALSRARYGFYLFGNGYLLSEKSELWSNVGRLMAESQPRRFGNELPLTCLNHHRTLTIKWPEDFDRNDGGCDSRCNSRLSCGHPCTLKCHPMPHRLLLCQEQCDKNLACGHRCLRKCHETCYCDRDDCHGDDHNTVGWHDDRGMSSINPSQSQHLDPAIGAFSGRSSSDEFQPDDARAFPVKLGRSGQALARGGAAFQPITRLSRDASLPNSQFPLGIQADAISKAGAQRYSDWTSLANDRVGQDNEVQATTIPYRGVQIGNLIDLSPPEAVPHVSEEQVQGGRSRFTQSYHGPVLQGSGSPTTRQEEQSTSKEGTPPEVQNWMD